jgi:hypothetical protein
MDVQSDAYNPAFAHDYRNAMDIASDSFNPATLYGHKNGMDIASDQVLRTGQWRERQAREAVGESVRELNRFASGSRTTEVPFAGRSTVTDPRAYETPQQRVARLTAMSNEPEKYTSTQLKAAAYEYKQMEGKGFTRDSIYNGLYMKALQLDVAAGSLGREAIDQTAFIAIE